MYFLQSISNLESVGLTPRSDSERQDGGGSDIKMNSFICYIMQVDSTTTGTHTHTDTESDKKSDLLCHFVKNAVSRFAVASRKTDCRTVIKLFKIGIITEKKTYEGNINKCLLGP